MTETTWTPTTIALSKLKPWERNPKRISKAHAARLLDLWERLGQFQTIAIGPGGEVYDGHQRLSVLKAKHGGSYVVQVLQASRPLTEAEREELTIAAHSGTTGSWDWDALAGWDVDNLTAWGLDEELLKDWNAGATALREMLAAETAATGEDPGPQVDKASELREKWNTAAGQLWELDSGNGYPHRLICGDCTDRAVVERVMGGEKADMVATDPPYGVDYEGKTKDKLVIANDGKDKLPALLSSSLGLAFDASRKGACWYVAAPPGPQFYEFATVLLDLGIWRQTICWQKNTMVLGHSDYHYKHEVIFYGWKPGAAHNPPPDRTQTTIWEFDKPSASREHPTMKPLGLYVLAIQNSTFGGDIVYEPFSGSGTTIMACEQLGRRCRAVEIDPGYVAVALERWATMTGQTPALLDGAP